MAAETCLTAAQIYDQITNGQGTGTLSLADQSAFTLAKGLDECAMDIGKLRQKTMAGYQGSAGEAAADLTTPLVQASVEDTTHLSNAKLGTTSQLDAFQTVKNSVKPVPAQPPEMTQQDIMDTVFGISPGYAMKVQGWQADSQQNIDAFGAYHSASTSNGERMPAQYAQLAQPDASISMDQGGTPPPPPPRQHGPGDVGPGQQQQPSYTQPPGGHQQQPGNPQQQPGQTVPPGTSGPGDSTHTSSFVPPPVNPVNQPVGGPYSFGPPGQPINASNNQGGFGPYGGGGFGPYGGGRSGSAPGEPGSGAGGRALGPGAGAGRGGVPEESTPGRGGSAQAGAAGSRGQNGMGGMGAGKGGKKEEDKEHKSPDYLREADPDETFGGYDVKPMPPVIGETRPRGK